MTNQTAPHLSSEEKYQERMRTWTAGPGLEFPNPQIEKLHGQRVGMLRDAIELRKPARLPICPFVGFYPIHYAGVTMREAMYDYSKLGGAMEKFYGDFEIDAYLSASSFTPGKVLDLLDYKLYRWAGHGVGDDQEYQTVEGEYMLEDEYDALTQDPSGYWMKRYLPRVFGALQPWDTLPNLTNILEIPNVGPALIPFGTPALQESLKTLMEAGQAAMEWSQAIAAIDRGVMSAHGLPRFRGGFSKAPFDMIADTLRGTRPMMFDLFRRPKKIEQAVERLVPMAIELGVRSATGSGCPLVFMPLHKGDDTLMSDRDFQRHYWPTLHAVILGLIDAGCVPLLFVEGSYNLRLKTLAEAGIPEGRTVWIFENTDMREAKAKVGGWGCIGGNVSGALMSTGSVEQVETYVKELVRDVAQDGGFILGTGVSLFDARAENLHALIRAGRGEAG